MTMDRAIPPEEIKAKRTKRMIQVAIVLSLVIVSIVFLRSCISPSISRQRLRTSIVELGCIDASLSASGVVVPEYEQVVTSPVRSTVVEVLRQSGDTVGAAQSIVRLDTEAAEFRVKQFRDQLNFHENQKRQLILELERREIDLAAYRDIKEMEVKFLESQLETVRKLNKLGGTAGEELTQAELNLDIARRQLLQLTRTVENQKTSLLAEIEGLDLQIQMKENEVRESERDLDLACARAERAGVVTWVNDNIGSYVGPGDVVARVADLSSYRIEAQISDMHAARLVVGGKVVVRVGDTRLRGIISAVKPSVENGIARFDVRLEDNDHSSLRPNLRTDVDVITSFKDDVLRVASGPFYKNRVDQKVFVIDGDQAIRRTIDIGLTNYDYVELIGDIQAGDEMVISDMSKYEHAGQVAITD